MRTAARSRRNRIETKALAGALLPLALAASCRVMPPPLAPLDPEPAPVTHAPSVRAGTFSERTPLGNELCFQVFGTGPSAVLLLGAIHGNEPMSHRLVERFAAHLLRHPTTIADATVVIASPINPDGLRKRSRHNSRGVDLNRNFPAENWTEEARFRGGKAPLSEPEARFVMHLLERFRPRLVISVHSPLHCLNYDGPARELAVAMGRLNGYAVKESVGYPTPGSLGSFVGVDLGVPIITLELPPGESPDGFLGENLSALMEAVARVRDGRA
jgi:protein MpaA